MSRTRINVSDVLSANGKISSAKNKISDILSSYSSSAGSVDSKIKNRSNISGRMNSIQNQLNEVKYGLEKIRSTVDNCANKYYITDKAVNTKGRQLKSVAAKSRSRSASMFASMFAVNTKKIKRFKITADELNSLINTVKTKKQKASDEEKAEKNKRISDILKTMSKGAKNASKTMGLIKEKKEEKRTTLSDSNKKIQIIGKDEIKYGGELLSYASTLYNTVTSDYETKGDAVCGVGKLASSSASAYSATYNYLESQLKIQDKIKFGQKYQTGASRVSLAGSLISYGCDTYDSYKVFTDETATTTQKVSQGLDQVSSTADVINAGFQYKYGFKQAGKLNQILNNGTPESQLSWSVATDNQAMLDKVGTGVAVGKVVLSSVKGAYEKTAEVNQDGFIDGGEMGEIGINLSTHGLASIIDMGTLGVLNVEEKAEVATNAITNVAETYGVEYAKNGEITNAYIKIMQPANDFVNNPDNFIGDRIVVNIGTGAGMIGTMAIQGVYDIGEGIVNGLCDIGEGIVNGISGIFGN